MKLEKTNNAKRNIIWGTLAKMVVLLLPFATRSALIYKLGSEYLGLSSLFTAVLSVLSIAELGFAEAVVYHMYKPIADGNDKKICAILNMFRKVYFVVGAIILAIGLALIPLLRFLIKGDVPADVNLYILYGVFLLNSTVSYFGLSYRQSLFMANQRNDIVNKVTTITNSLMSLTQLAVLLLFPNYYLYIAWLPVFTLLSYVIQFFIAKKKYPNHYPSGSLSSEEKREIRKSVSGIVFHKLGGVLSNSADSIIISAFLGLTILAIYSNYLYVVGVLSGFYAIITDSILGGVGNSIAIDTKEKNYKDMLKFSFMGCWIVGFVTVCMACIYQPFMYAWVGPDLMFNLIVMFAFCIYFFLMKFDSICGVYKSAAGIWTQDKWRPLISGLVNLTLNIVVTLLLVNYKDGQYAVLGALISSILCKVFIDFLWGTRVTFKYYFGISEKQYILKTVFYLLVTILATVASFMACYFIPMERGWLGLALILARGGICLIIPNLVFLLFYFKTEQFKESVDFVKLHLHRNK